MEPLVSIIIPCFNRAGLITETLRSISHQSYPNWECIIIDDGSTDNSAEVIKGFLSDYRFRYYLRPPHLPKGANPCRNYGFTVSKGAFINWFDSDDIMHPNFIIDKVQALCLDPELDAVISKRAVFKDDPNIIISKESRTNLSPDVLSDFLQFKITWYLQDVMWNRTFLIDKDLFDEALLAGQDRDFHSRMLLHDPKLKIVDEYLTFYRRHATSITASINNLKDTRLKVSHLHAIVKLINLLEARGKLTPAVRHHYFKVIRTYLPYVVSDKSNLPVWFRLLKKLSFGSQKIFVGWIKIIFGYISLRLTGKGHSFLK
ncbi:MAG TPA: glycosyltransferase [Flavobacterium sp.]|jgi:glycosyltransferase involved in cell wall biosynthesis